LRGKPDAALDAANYAVDLGEQGNHPFSIAFAMVFLARVHLMRGDFAEAAAANRRAAEIADEQSSQPMRASSRIVAAYLDARESPGGSGVEALAAGIAAWEASGARLALPYFKSLLADALRIEGHANRALEELADAQALVSRYGERWWEPELHRLVGSCRVDLDQPERALTAYAEAVRTAQAIGAVSLEARAKAELAALASV